MSAGSTAWLIGDDWGSSSNICTTGHIILLRGRSGLDPSQSCTQGRRIPAGLRPPEREGTTRRLAAAQRVDIDGQGLEGRRIEAIDPGGHHAISTVGNTLNDSRLVRAVEPDCVGEVWGPQFLVALTVLAVADSAI